MTSEDDTTAGPGKNASECHPKLSEAQALHEIDSVKSYVRGKKRRSDFWLSASIDKIVEGKKAGLGEAS